MENTFYGEIIQEYSGCLMVLALKCEIPKALLRLAPLIDIVDGSIGNSEHIVHELSLLEASVTVVVICT